MHLLEGVAAILVSVCIYAWAYGKHHGPGAPGWAKGQLFASLISVLLVALFPVGAGFVALGLTEAMTPASWAGLVALAVLPVAIWKAVPRLARRA
ncbi:hypothetical protein ACOXXX_10235 [Thalassococcus sp. BH17M4-6]|uniref:hypothetical protein n=1 Tax=Thalassococcus sp. BH17M4-6 TaxID=3413148 RepID=UPI003BDCAB35